MQLAQFKALVRGINGVSPNRPKNLSKAIGSLPPMGTLPAPRATWLLVALFVYRQRQQWAKQFVQEHMPAAIPPRQRLYDLGQPVIMDLPGDPEWQIQLECETRWGVLTNRASQEMITFGLTRKDAEVILFLDDFPRFAQPTSRWEPAGRVLELDFPDSGIQQSIDDLVAARLLDGIDFDGSLYEPWLYPAGYRLNRHLAAEHAPGILRFCELWKDADRRLWLAAMIGDWGLAYELSQLTSDAKLIAITGEQAEQCRAFEIT